MKVLSIIHYGVFGGPHNRALRLIPILRDQGIDTIVVLPDELGNAAERIRAAGIEVITIPLGRVRARVDPRIQARFLLGFWPEVRALRRIIRERSIDVVWLNAMTHPHGALAAALEGVPTLWELVDVSVPMVLRRLMMPWIMRTAGCVMAVGYETARAHPGAASLGNRLMISSPPVDTDAFKPDTSRKLAARRELGVAGEEVVVGNVANLLPYKDHITFLRAAAELRRSHPRTRFVLLGYTYAQFAKYADSITREAQSLGLRFGHDVVLRDPGARVAELAHAIDIFWMTSKAVEAGPTAMFEAMALGVPVVATDVGASREVIEQGVTGFVVPKLQPRAIASATARIVDDPALRAAMASEARQVAVKRFDARVCAELHARALRMAAAQSMSTRALTVSA